MKAYERFLNYVTIPTTSKEDSNTFPSTSEQFKLAEYLCEELTALGVKGEVDPYGYVYAVLPATPGYEEVTPIGFLSHMDTSPECSGTGVKPLLTPNYDGSDLKIGDLTLTVKDFPHLPSLKGRTLITASGDTLLGADDKAGVAEIMTMVERLLNEKRPHGKICIGFTPDEEIGQGVEHFDVARFGAAFAYTVDGEKEGGVEYENFNGAGAEVKIKGFSVHPGASKDTMINAALVGIEFNSMLPSGDIPRNTEGYEGFFHLTDFEGDVTEATLHYIVRDHDAASFACREKTMRHITALLNEKYRPDTVTLLYKEQYRNMAEKVLPHKAILDIAFEATERAGVEPFYAPIRGGTDGARLSYMGLPCPNLGTGGYAFHGPCEHITVEAMDAVTDILLGIVALFAEGKDKA